MDKQSIAVSYFKKGYNCSQSVLGAFCEELGMDLNTGFKIACGFGGGMRKGDTCGAVVGAIMVIGLKRGQFIEGDADTKQNTYLKVLDFRKRFTEINKTINCKELLGYDISNPDDYDKIIEEKLFITKCPQVISECVGILEEIL